MYYLIVYFYLGNPELLRYETEADSKKDAESIFRAELGDSPNIIHVYEFVDYEDMQLQLETFDL